MTRRKYTLSVSHIVTCSCFFICQFVCMYVCMVVCMYVCTCTLSCPRRRHPVLPLPCSFRNDSWSFQRSPLHLVIVGRCRAVVLIRPPLRIPCYYAASFASLPDIHPALASRPGLTSRPCLPDIPNDASLSLDRNNGPVTKRVRRGPVTLSLAHLARSGTKECCAAS